jgi:non-ribosomal peptide synthase protein (TIGR01720 family)
VLEGGRLRVGWTTAPGRFRAATVERLAGRFLEELRSLVDHAQSPDALGYTPSDFPQAGLDQAGLDELVRSLGMGAGPEEAR